MKVTMKLHVSGFRLQDLQAVLTKVDLGVIGKAHARRTVERIDRGVDAEGNPIPPNDEGKFLELTGQFKRRMKPERASARGVTVASRVPYMAQIQERVPAVGFTPAEADAINGDIQVAFERHIKETEK